MGAALAAVYNHYLASYAPKGLTRFDAHKSSELRSIYNSMVKLNKEAPWYLPTTNQETKQYVVALKENARQLHNTIALLGGLEEGGLLSKKSAFSSNPELVTASYIGPHDSEAESPCFEIEVHALASPQQNTGLFLEDTKISFSPGTYSFDITAGDMSYEFQFTLDGTETNRQLQERIARLINNSAIGVKASLAESSSRTSLVLTSEATGIPQGKTDIFKVNDDHTSKTPGTVAYLGLDNISSKAADAVYSINGQKQSSPTNHFHIENLFDVSLKGVTSETESVRIGLKTDIDSLTDNITQLMGGYNAFLRAAASFQNTQAKSSQLIHEFEGIASDYESSMKSSGLNLTPDGTVQVNRQLLHETAEQSPDAAQTFAFLKSFCSRLLRKSNQVSLNPMQYVEKKVVAYKNPGHNFISPYNAAVYSGMMFNGYC